MFATPKSVFTLKLGFLSPHNPYDRMTFSGTSWFAAGALDKHPGIDLRILGPHKAPGRFTHLLRRRPAPVDVGALDLDGLDAVLGLVASPLLDALNQRHPTMPFFHVTDATPAFLRDAYGWAVPQEADALERRVSANAHATIFSSDPIAARAPADLGLPNLQSAVIPFGVNLEDLPRDCPEKPPLDKLRLLFVGIDWARKGGDVALAVLDRLNAAGYPTELTVVGRCPANHRGHPGLIDAGFLNKTRPGDREKLAALYRQAHFLILPSRGDCAPMVVAEAMAHGTPVLATDTGGIDSQIGGGKAGRTLPPMAPPSAWVQTILEMVDNPDLYRWTSDSAFERCNALFSWESWAAAVETEIRDRLMETTQESRRTA